MLLGGDNFRNIIINLGKVESDIVVISKGLFMNLIYCIFKDF